MGREKGAHLFFALRRAATTPKLDTIANSPLNWLLHPGITVPQTMFPVYGGNEVTAEICRA